MANQALFQGSQSRQPLLAQRREVAHDLVLWKQRVLPHNIRITLHTTVVRIEPGQVIVVDRFAEGEHVLPADAVVLGTKGFSRV